MSPRADNKGEFKCVFIAKTGGIQRRLYERAIKEREYFGKEIGSFQLSAKPNKSFVAR